ncbi:MAG: hypothetical protein U1E29_08350 [Coriobacteriia bacterium]|nr:hypothetical protein [Coriobacteriia bacterium]
MKRILLASSRNWICTARLPSTFAAAGFTVDLLGRPDTMASCSRHVASNIPVAGPASEFAAALLEVAPRYDRVIVCDEMLLRALLRSYHPDAATLLPAASSVLERLLDKTRFPALARACGITVAPSVVASNPGELADAVAGRRGRIVLKGRHGIAGTAVRVVGDAAAADAAAARIGYPVLVEEWVDGLLGMVPCLFERGRLLGAMAAEKHRTITPLGPSAVNIVKPVDAATLSMVERAGAELALHGFVSFDDMNVGYAEEPVVLEINPRPVAQLHVGRRVGVDFAALLRDAADTSADQRPVLSTRAVKVALFPQELQRQRLEHGHSPGLTRWALTPGALRDVPVGEPALVWRHLTRDD